jgi:hypothetical protein
VTLICSELMITLSFSNTSSVQMLTTMPAKLEFMPDSATENGLPKNSRAR